MNRTFEKSIIRSRAEWNTIVSQAMAWNVPREPDSYPCLMLWLVKEGSYDPAATWEEQKRSMTQILISKEDIQNLLKNES